ncbi:MAG: hypothetical protein COA97_06205 [Flavobacteriales bacterium]|nr:MAG: hypothetical protein COA97_06205 [Flavobacteriales bacterium]
MKRMCLILLLLFGILYSQNSTGQNYFNKRYEFNGWADAAYSVVEVDSGYYVVGYVYDSLFWYMSIEVMYLDTAGNKVWGKAYGEPYYNNIPGSNGSFIPTTDGGYVLGGLVVDTLGNRDGKLYRFNSYGDTLWTRVYGDAAFQSFVQCKQTTDNGFILSGANTTFDSDGDFWLVKTDSAGNMEWSQTYGGSLLEYGWSVDVCSDGGYIIAGITRSFGPGAGSGNFYVVKTDSLGNVDWTRFFGGPYAGDGAWNIEQTSDNGYIICGYLTDTVISGNFFSQPNLIKLDSTGNTLWDKTYGAVSYEFGFQMVRELVDGSLITTGVNGIDRSFVMKLNANGDSLWYRGHVFPGSVMGDINIFQDIQPTTDKGYIAVGWHTSNAPSDMWVVKMDSMGCAVWSCAPTGVEEVPWEPNADVNIYPNPNTGTFTIDLIDANNASIQIYSIAGQLVFQKSMIQNATQIDLSNYPKGMYIVRVKTNTATVVRKIVYQ